MSDAAWRQARDEAETELNRLWLEGDDRPTAYAISCLARKRYFTLTGCTRRTSNPRYRGPSFYEGVLKEEYDPNDPS